MKTAVQNKVFLSTKNYSWCVSYFRFLFFFLMRKSHDSSPEVYQKTTLKNLRRLIRILRHKIFFCIIYYFVIFQIARKKLKKEIRRGIAFTDFFVWFLVMFWGWFILGVLGMIHFHLIGGFFRFLCLGLGFFHLFALFFLVLIFGVCCCFLGFFNGKNPSFLVYLP